MQRRFLQENTDLSCCRNCLDQPNIRGIDALVFEKCSAANEGCCFENNCHMSTIGGLTWHPSIVFEKGMATIEQGNWILVQWSSVTNVTFLLISEGEEKTRQPKYSSNAAVQSGEEWYQICAQQLGDVYFRGWKDEGCSASMEQMVRVKKSSKSSQNGNTCSSQPNLPKTIDGTNAGECNLNRASINSDGECVCVADWAGPPNCGGMPLWKWLVSIGAGVAAAVSMMVSVHAFLERRKKRKAEESQSATEIDMSDHMDVLRLSTAPAYYDASSARGSTRMSSKYLDRKSLGSPQECTL